MQETGNSEEKLAQNTKISNVANNSFFMLPNHALEVDGIIKQLKLVSTPGLDGLSNQLLKQIKHGIISSLVHIPI